MFGNAGTATVAKKAAGGKPTATMRLYVDLIEMANVVAVHTGRNAADVVDKLLRPGLEREHREAVTRAAKALERKKGSE